MMMMMIIGAHSTFLDKSHVQRDPDILCVALEDKAHMNTCCEPGYVSDNFTHDLTGGSQSHSLGEESESQRANNFLRSHS